MARSSRDRGVILNALAWLSLAAALGPLAACYESDREIIPVELGEAVPYRHDLVGWAGDEDMTHFGRGAAGNDYRFENHRDDEVNTGALRAMRLQGDIFAVQVRPDDADYYDILFYRITSDTVTRVVVASEADAQALAARAGVTLEGSGFGYSKLSGEPAAMLAFVRGHAQLSFKVWQKQ